jgi:hypothetical protein
MRITKTDNNTHFSSRLEIAEGLGRKNRRHLLGAINELMNNGHDNTVRLRPSNESAKKLVMEVVRDPIYSGPSQRKYGFAAAEISYVGLTKDKLLALYSKLLSDAQNYLLAAKRKK